MASLAPGNGWFPNRNPERSQEPRRGMQSGGRAGAGESNVYAFPPARSSVPAHVEAGGLVSGALASWLARSARSGRSPGWIVGWCVFGIALASLAWLSMIGALFAAAIIFGVPWMTAAVAFGAAHLLAAALAALVGVRVSRTLLPSPQRPPLPK